jgi:hypothetical protein
MYGFSVACEREDKFAVACEGKLDGFSVACEGKRRKK